MEYWATRWSARSFAHTAHLFACSVLLTSLTRSAALTRSLTSSLMRKRTIRWLFVLCFFVLAHSALVPEFCSETAFFISHFVCDICDAGIDGRTDRPTSGHPLIEKCANASHQDTATLWLVSWRDRHYQNTASRRLIWFFDVTTHLFKTLYPFVCLLISPSVRLSTHPSFVHYWK